MKRKLAVVMLVPVVALGMVGCGNSEPASSEQEYVSEQADCDNNDAAKWEEEDCGYYDPQGYWIWHPFVSSKTRAYAKGNPPKGLHKVHSTQAPYNANAQRPMVRKPNPAFKQPEPNKRSLWDKMTGGNKNGCKVMIGKPGGGGSSSSGGGSRGSGSSSSGGSKSGSSGSSSGGKSWSNPFSSGNKGGSAPKTKPVC